MKNKIRRSPRITFDRAYLRLNRDSAPQLSNLDLHLLNEDLRLLNENLQRDLKDCKEYNAYLKTELEKMKIHNMLVVNTILTELFPGLSGSEISRKAGEYSVKAFLLQQIYSAQSQVSSFFEGFGGAIE